MTKVRTDDEDDDNYKYGARFGREHAVARDGEVVSVTMQMLDEQRHVALSDARQAMVDAWRLDAAPPPPTLSADAAYGRLQQRLSDAWRDDKAPAEPVSSSVSDAFAKHEKWLTNAWRQS